MPENGALSSYSFLESNSEGKTRAQDPKSTHETDKVVSVAWEVLNGVGVDGVGVIFPCFCAFFRFSLFFFVFLRFSLLLPKDKGKQQQFTANMGDFTPTPSAPTPCKISRVATPADCRCEKTFEIALDILFEIAGAKL